MKVVVTLVPAIDALLPQTQCTRCGYAGCAPYAAAIAGGEADINRCPPGGPETIARLAAVTGRPARPLDATCGEHAPLRIAVIDPDRCIGCTLCIAACPVDAIVGAAKRLHGVLSTLCSGCELCVAPCPVDCIDMVPAQRDWTPADATAARLRHDRRNARVARAERIALRRGVAARHAIEASPTQSTAADARRAAVAAALERARARRHA